MNVFLQSKLAKTESLISKVSKITCLTSKYHILIFSINNKLRHLCRSLASSSPAVAQFCDNFDAVTTELFLKEFHILNLNHIVTQHIKLRTSNSGMGLLSIRETAPAAYLASVRNLIAEITLTSNNSPSPRHMMRDWTLEHKCSWNWTKFHNNPQDLDPSSINALWSHDSFLALPQRNAQKFLPSKTAIASFNNQGAICLW